MVGGDSRGGTRNLIQETQSVLGGVLVFATVQGLSMLERGGGKEERTRSCPKVLRS